MDASRPALRRLELDGLATAWQRALDAAQHALVALHGELPEAELARRAQALASERERAARALRELAVAASVRPQPWLAPIPLRPELLGLPAHVQACVLDLEGVLTDGAALHAWAWRETLDDLLRRLGERAGRVLPLFAPRDYGAYLEGRPRLEGVRLFLAARGLSLQLGEPDDPSGINTMHAVARRKSELLTSRLEHEGVTAFPGAHRYLVALGHLGLPRAVLSASVRTAEMLELAGLGRLVEERVDADRIRDEGLRSRPAPDALLAVCRHLKVEPTATVAFTSASLGVQAGLAAGMTVVGVRTGAGADELTAAGATRVVDSLHALLDVRLTAGI
jgi:beta-phosphoglucomutase-like phosphatase (HAD superfamily)